MLQIFICLQFSEAGEDWHKYLNCCFFKKIYISKKGWMGNTQQARVYSQIPLYVFGIFWSLCADGNVNKYLDILMMKFWKQACFGGSLEKLPFSWRQRWNDGEKQWKMSQDTVTEPESNHEICAQATSHSRWHLQLFIFFFESKEYAEVTRLNTTTWDKVDLLAYPLGGRDPQTVLVCLKTTDVADLGDEVDIFPILGLLTLAPLVFPIKVIEAAGQDEVSAGVRWPAGRESYKIIILKFGFNNLSWSFSDRLTRHPVRCNTAPQWPPGVAHAFKRTLLFPLAEISWRLSSWMRLCVDNSPGCYNWDPRRELIWVVPNQPVRTRK